MFLGIFLSGLFWYEIIMINKSQEVGDFFGVILRRNIEFYWSKFICFLENFSYVYLCFVFIGLHKNAVEIVVKFKFHWAKRTLFVLACFVHIQYKRVKQNSFQCLWFIVFFFSKTIYATHRRHVTQYAEQYNELVLTIPTVHCIGTLNWIKAPFV